MISITPSLSITASYAFEDLVDKHIKDYINTRDAFNKVGGDSFCKDRQKVRADYLNAAVSHETIEKWIADLPIENVRDEFTRRFQEWDAKIAKGIIKKSDTPDITKEEFFYRLSIFYNTHTGFLQSSAFADFTQAKTNLRRDLLPLLKNTSAEELAKRFNIKDEELIERMKREWSWKA